MPSSTSNFKLIKNMVRQLIAIAVAIIILDLIFAVFLIWIEGIKPNNAISTYVNYGRSVQGKQAQWETDPKLLGNLSKVAWRDDIINLSEIAYRNESNKDSKIRSYGMSFSNNILNSAFELDQTIKIDLHSGPAVPPNFVYSILNLDKDNRNSGDTVVFAILSSSIKAMGSFTNATWNFEQPAPFTYPVFRYDEKSQAVTRVEPTVKTYNEHLLSLYVGAERKIWLDQLAQDDQMWNWRAYAFPMLDHSPFLKFVRRALVSRSQKLVSKEALRISADRYFEVLKWMLLDSKSTLDSDCQNLVVFLIQTADPSDPQLEKQLSSFLRENKIKFLSTNAIAPSSEPSNYRADGHFTPKVDELFAQVFLKELKTNDATDVLCER